MITYERPDGTRFVLSELTPDEFADRLVSRLAGRTVTDEDGKTVVVGGLGIPREAAERIAGRYRGAGRV
jgi:hypothetical protein